jgi:hypothetical protein
MIGLVRDTWRAVLVVVVAVLLRAIFAERPAAATAPVAPAWQPAAVQWAPPPVATGAWHPMPAPAVETQGPIRRVAREFVDLSEAVLGVVR